MDWSEFIKQVLTLLGGILFTWLIGKYPDFPLSEKDLINFLIWLFTIMGIIHGLRYQYWNIRNKLFRLKTPYSNNVN